MKKTHLACVKFDISNDFVTLFAYTSFWQQKYQLLSIYSISRASNMMLALLSTSIVVYLKSALFKNTHPFILYPFISSFTNPMVFRFVQWKFKI